MIKAEIHSDDWVSQTEFDATRWFEQASWEEIDGLVECGWRGDYQADAVAEYFEDESPVKEVFEYVQLTQDLPSKKDCCGFEVSVDSDAAIDWLVDNRPEFAKRLLREAIS